MDDDGILVNCSLQESDGVGVLFLSCIGLLFIGNMSYSNCPGKNE